MIIEKTLIDNIANTKFILKNIWVGPDKVEKV